jgi:hypothetical protein
LEREKLEGVANTDANTHITIETGFECSPKMEVHEISPTHFALQVPSPQWFMFRVHGVAGKTVRFDMVNPGVGLQYWSTLNPVYTYATDLDDPATYAVDGQADVAMGQQKEERAWSGAVLPSTARQKWHFISNAWQESVNQFSFVQRFEANDAVVAMRVPYPPGYNERFFKNLASNPDAKVIEIGRSTQNRPLLLVKIGDGGDDPEREKPCILIYAGEHADEADAMWVAEGAISACLADRPQARELRDRFAFLIITTLDPDAAAAAEHMGITCTFLARTKTRESIAYASWFRNWINAGKRLDVVIDLHNVQSSESPPVACALMECVGLRGKASSALHARIVEDFNRSGIVASSRPWMRGWSPDRLGGWLSSHYGPLTLAYEINSQAPDSHLDLQGLKDVGVGFATTVPRFLGSAEGAALYAEIDTRRKKRLAEWATYGTCLGGDLDPIEGEGAVAWTARMKTGDPSYFAEASIP